AEQRAAMAPQALYAIQQLELDAVMAPYVGMAFFLITIWIMIALVKLPKSEKVAEKVDPEDKQYYGFIATLGRLIKLPNYRWGVVSQFFNVACQTCTWTFTL
ncbi:glucose/galactose MFS transporter, partial [Marinomonas arenicola]